MEELLKEVAALRKPAEAEDVSRLVSHLDNLREQGNISIPVLEEVVKVFKARERNILAKELPEWMFENGQQTGFETDNFKVSIDTYVNTKISDPEKAFAWLTECGYGDLYKDTLDFPKGELSEEMLSELEASGVSFTRKSGIHPQTLKKVISDRIKDGETLPDEGEGIQVNYFDICKVKEK